MNMILSFKLFISKIKIFIQFLIKVIKLRHNRKESRIYLLNIPSHGNMGDQLIAEAELQLLKTQFPSHEIIEITSAELWSTTLLLKICIAPNDTICYTGGGYLGSLWIDEELRIRSVIKNYKSNTIIILPQTVYYDNVNSKLCENAQKIYEAHNSLYFFTREAVSYEFVKKYILPNKNENVFLTPDIALTYKVEKQSTNNHPKKVLFCVRKDKEKIDSTDRFLGIIKRNIPKSYTISYTDTQVLYSVPIDKRLFEIKKIISEFSSSSFIVTDRLHGMIYAAISGVPVIALDNSSGKVGNVYRLWLRKYKPIYFINKEEEILPTIMSITNQNKESFDYRKYSSYFDVLLKIIK